MRGLAATLRVLGWTILGLLALTGVALSALVAFASSSAGRPVVAARLIQLLDDRIAGSVKLGGVEILPGGAIAVRDFTAYDPEGALVLQVDRLLVSADLRRLRNRVVGFEVELEGAAVLVDEDEAGRLSLARAFAPAHPSPERPAARRPAGWRDPLGGWTLALRRLELRDASLWWQDARGRTRVELQGVGVTARALVGPRRGRTEVSLRGDALAPVAGPLSVELRATLDEDRLSVPLLQAGLGGTRVAGLADVDLGTRVGRAALTRAEIDRAQARDLVRGAPPGEDLAFHAFAEADGAIATLAARVEPQADAAVAVRLDGLRALGFDVVARELDPAALHAAAPAGKLSLRAHGGFSVPGAGVGSLRGNLDLALDRSTLRGGELGPAAAAVHVEPGIWEARRLSLVAPGVKLEGKGSWREGGAAEGHLAADVADLTRAAKNAEKLLGRGFPALAGAAHVEADLAGTAAAPSISAQVSAPSLTAGGTTASGVEARVAAKGPFRPGEVTIAARLGRIRAGERVLAHGLTLDGSLGPEEGGGSAASLTASGNVPSLGREPVSLDAAGTVAADRATLRLGRLAIAYPGTRYALEEPATLTFSGPRVDRLALAAGPRRIELEGGIGPKKELDARLRLVKLDLARLPVGILPADQGIAGEVTADARASGALSRPVVDANLAIEGGGYRSEQGLGIDGTLRYDGAARRAGGRVAIRRAKGGTVDAAVELPVPLRARSSEALSGKVRVAAVPLPAVLALARSEAPVRGTIDAELTLSGTAGAPALEAKVSVPDGGVRDLDAIGLTADVELGQSGKVTADVRLSGQPAAHVEGRTPLSAPALLAAPGRAVKEQLLGGRTTADVTLPGLELAAISGRLGVPSGLRGRLAGEVHLAGRPPAPRGTARFTLADGAWDGYPGIAGTVAAEAREDGVEARAAISASGQAVLDLTARLGAPVETLARRAGLAAAPLRVDAVVPSVDLDRAGGSAGVRIAGIVEAKLHAEGTLARPAISFDASGRHVRISGRPLGAVRLSARAAGERGTADLTLDPPAGGKLVASATLSAPISIDLRGEALRTAPAEVKVRAESVDLSFLPAVAPGTIRSASGRLEADLAASGPLAELVPRGSVRLAGARLGLLEYGDWSDIALDGSIGADAVEVRTFDARRGDGTLSLRAALHGLSGPGAARLDGRLEAKKLTISRAGADLGTLTLGVKLSGTYRDRHLDARLDLPQGEVRLADKLPRELQSLEKRSDIVIGPKPPPKRAPAEGTPGAPGAGGRRLGVTARLVAPGKFFVRRDVPRIGVELKCDVTYEHREGDYMSGTVEVVRGQVEPLSDRRFDVKRGRVTFTGGPPKAALLDVEAGHSAAGYDVTVTVSGPLARPVISLKSQPPLDEQTIAMLIATGQVQTKAGASGAAAAGQGQAALAENAAQKLGFAVFNTFIRNQLPFPTGDVSVDTSGARVGGYVPGTPVFIVYTRRFDANKELHENQDEVRVEYAIDSHWTLEGRWGNANSGAASLIWSKDY